MQHRKNLFSPASSTIVWAVLSLGAGACMLDRASTQADLLASTSSVGGATASSSGDFVASNSASSTSNTSSSSSSSSAGGAGGAPATWLTGFAQRKALTVPKEQVSGTLSNFVLPIVVTDPDLVNKAQADGDDIVFTTTDSTQQLDHELVRFDALTGELVLWLRAPSLASNQDNTFYMYQTVNEHHRERTRFRNLCHWQQHPTYNCRYSFTIIVTNKRQLPHSCQCRPETLYF